MTILSDVIDFLRLNPLDIPSIMIIINKIQNNKGCDKMNCEINFTFDNGDKWTGKFESVSSIICKSGECETQDVIISYIEKNEKKSTKIFWVIDFQIIVK